MIFCKIVIRSGSHTTKLRHPEGDLFRFSALPAVGHLIRLSKQRYEVVAVLHAPETETYPQLVTDVTLYVIEKEKDPA